MNSSRCYELERDWSYQPSRRSTLVRLSRLKSLATGLCRAPASAAIVPITPRDRWNTFFIYLPDGKLSPAQRYSIERIGALTGGTAIVCAAPSVGDVPAELLTMADAIYWKALSGFDFSAYALMLCAVAERSSGADLYLQNDSVLGPFADVDELLAQAPWDLSGFMGSAALENHIQSYAFLVRRVDRVTVARLASVMSTRWACNRWRDVVNLQETRFARVAAAGMSVGALWFAPRAGDGEISLDTAITRKLARSSARPVNADVRDPTLVAGLELVIAGFPFLKKSLFGRNRALQDANALAAFIAEQGHPPVIEGTHDAGR